MPLIEVDALPQPAGFDAATVVVAINQAVAAAIPCRLDAVWTVWRTVSGPSARGDDVATEQRDPHGPVVHVYLQRTAEQTSRAVAAIEEVLERELALRPGSVFVTVQPVEHAAHGD